MARAGIRRDAAARLPRGRSASGGAATRQTDDPLRTPPAPQVPCTYIIRATPSSSSPPKAGASRRPPVRLAIADKRARPSGPRRRPAARVPGDNSGRIPSQEPCTLVVTCIQPRPASLSPRPPYCHCSHMVSPRRRSRSSDAVDDAARTHPMSPRNILAFFAFSAFALLPLLANDSRCRVDDPDWML